MKKGSFKFFYEDEAGKNPLNIPGEIIFEVEYCFSPPEPMVRYYKDGSGYPGCDAEFELSNFKATKFLSSLTLMGGTELTEDDSKLISDWLSTVFNDGRYRDRLVDAICEEIEDGRLSNLCDREVD